jgi:site-specific recombinase XerD
MNTPAIKINAPSPVTPGGAARRRRERDLWALTADTVIERFLDCYWVKYGVSPETLLAYREDLIALDRWMVLLKQKTLVSAMAQDIRDYLDVKYRTDGGIQRDPPSLSCVKRFYFYLLDYGFRDDDPTENVFVRTPRLVRRDLSLVQTTPAAGTVYART